MAICYEQADLCSRALYTVYSFDEAVTGYRKVTWFIGVFCKHTRNQPVKKLIACPITASLCLGGNVSTRFLKVLQDMCVRIPSAEIPVGVVYLLLTGRFLAFMGQVLAGPRVWCLKASAFFLAFKPIFRNARRSAFLCPHHCGNSLLFRLLPYSNPILSKEHRDTLFQIPETLKLGKESS